MKLEEFIGKMVDAAELYALPLEILYLTDHSVKARITILEDIWIQFYYHEISGTTNLVLIGWSNRLFARDCIHGSWHMHPFENPDHHVFTINNSIEPTPISFMEEIFEWLVKKGLF